MHTNTLCRPILSPSQIWQSLQYKYRCVNHRSVSHGLDPNLLQTSSSPCYKRDGGISTCWGRVVLTWHRDEELDCITVAMEAELCLSHGAVRNEAAGRFVTVVITIHMDDPTRATALSRSWWSLVGWRQSKNTISGSYESPLQNGLNQRENSWAVKKNL